MAEHLSADALKQRYIETMQSALGEFFHHLMQESARLHLKWNEYEALFNSGPEKVANMNKAAPGFFWLTQNALWHDIILSVCRITDNGSRVLSVKQLPRKTTVALRDELSALIEHLDTVAKPIRDVRDKYIAHLDYDILRDPNALDDLMPERAAVLKAIEAIDDLLHFLDHHFTRSGKTYWQYLNTPGGAQSLHDIIRRGLRDRDERFARFDFMT